MIAPLLYLALLAIVAGLYACAPRLTSRERRWPRVL